MLCYSNGTDKKKETSWVKYNTSGHYRGRRYNNLLRQIISGWNQCGQKRVASRKVSGRQFQAILPATETNHRKPQPLYTMSPSGRRQTADAAAYTGLVISENLYSISPCTVIVRADRACTNCIRYATSCQCASSCRRTDVVSY